MYIRLKRLLLGSPIRKSQIHEEKLPKKFALPQLASDALSSIAYAPGELMYQFVAVSAIAGLACAIPLALTISIVIITVISLYREVIKHYPGGGGGYTVVKSNFGPLPSLVAAAALLTDYVLTVSVSVVAGVAQLEEIFHALKPYRIEVSCAVIVFIAIMNLRGYRESGRFFAGWTYGFIGMFSLLLIVGMAAFFTGHLPHAAPSAIKNNLDALTWFIILRAFASGATALTGIEAVSNGVPIFREPQQKNARTTLFTLGCIIVTFLLGATVLARAVAIVPKNAETLIPQLGALIFPTLADMVPVSGIAAIAQGCSWLLTLSLAIILLIAANTAFTDLPIVCSNLARDSFLPRQFRNRGDRQVFSTGIIVLTLLAIVPVWTLRGELSALIPLYGIGVFISFSLVAASIAKRSAIEHPKQWYGFGIALIAGTVSMLVLGIFIYTKFAQGGFIILLILPGIVWLMRRIHKSYERHKDGLRLEAGRTFAPRPVANTVIIALGNIDKEALKIVNRAHDITGKKIAVHVEEDEERANEFRRQWEILETGIPLEILKPDHNSISAAIVDFVRTLRDSENKKETEDPAYIHHLYVVIGEVVPDTLFANVLHGQTALFISTALRSMPQVTPLIVRYTPNQPPRNNGSHGSGIQNGTPVKTEIPAAMIALVSKE